MMRPKSSGIVAVIAAGVFAWAPLARAASAVIVAPGAQARAQPTETAAVLQTYATGDKVFVSPEITAGFRQIALPDKRTGFIRDDDVRVDGAPAPVQPLSKPHPLFIVKNLDQLADLTKDDSLLGPRTHDLVHNGHVVAGVAGGALGASLLIGSLSLLFMHDVCAGSGATQLCQQEPNFTFLGIAGGVFLVGGIVALALTSRDTPIDILNDWNQRHPDRPLTLAPAAVASPDPSPPLDMTPPPPPPPLIPIPGVDFPIGPPP